MQALSVLFAEVPAIKLLDIEQVASGLGNGSDIVAQIEVSGSHRKLICEVKSTGQPRHVRAALLQLRHYITQRNPGAIPILIAPYLSPDAQALCREFEVGFLDLVGNIRLVFDSVFIERLVASKPVSERRELRSMFKPKSAQVLRVMLRDPTRTWRVIELAKAAGVSLGHVSNVRTSLLSREWGLLSNGGLFLSNPNALLDKWRDAYEPPAAKRLAFYTTLHGSVFEDAARRALRSQDAPDLAIFASFSAAQWLAPYGRTGTQYFYADEKGLEQLKRALKLAPIAKGENVVVSVVTDSGLFRDAVQPAPGAFCTGLVQTYLDLAIAGERGLEAAEHLRQERLKWSN